MDASGPESDWIQGTGRAGARQVDFTTTKRKTGSGLLNGRAAVQSSQLYDSFESTLLISLASCWLRRRQHELRGDRRTAEETGIAHRIAWDVIRPYESRMAGCPLESTLARHVNSPRSAN